MQCFILFGTQAQGSFPFKGKDRMGMGVFRLDTFNPIPSLTLPLKGRVPARPEGPLNTKHYTRRPSRDGLFLSGFCA